MRDFDFDAVLAVDEREAEDVLGDAAVARPPFAPAFAFVVFEPDEPVLERDEAVEVLGLELEVLDFEDADERPDVGFDPPVDLAVLFEPPLDLPDEVFDVEAAVERPPFAPAFAFCELLPPRADFADDEPEVRDFDAVDFEPDELLPEEVFDRDDVDFDGEDFDEDERDALDFEPLDFEPLDFELPEREPPDFEPVDLEDVDRDEDLDPDDFEPEDFEPEDFDPEVFLVVGILISTLRNVRY